MRFCIDMSEKLDMILKLKLAILFFFQEKKRVLLSWSDRHLQARHQSKTERVKRNRNVRWGTNHFRRGRFRTLCDERLQVLSEPSSTVRSYLDFCCYRLKTTCLKWFSNDIALHYHRISRMQAPQKQHLLLLYIITSSFCSSLTKRPTI